MSNIPFVRLIQAKFDEMGKDLAELDSALRRLESLEEHIIERGNYEEFIKVVSVMGNVAAKTREHRKHLDQICMDALSKAESNKGYINKIQQIIKKISFLGDESLTYASRLPFSLGSGWEGGRPFSTIRHLVNLPGYLMMVPFTTTGLAKSAYGKYLFEVNNAVRQYKNVIENKGKGDLEEAKAEIKKAMKDFRAFIRISRQFDRTFRRTARQCIDIANDVHITLPEEKYISTDVRKVANW